MGGIYNQAYHNEDKRVGARCIRCTCCNTCRWLVVFTCVVLYWSGMARQVTAQSCTTVTDSYQTCEQSGVIKVSFHCPTNYIIKVISASYHVADTPICPAKYSGDPPSDHCLVSGDPNGISSQCNNKGMCTKDVAWDTRGTCSGNGAHYIRIVHYCEPLQHLNLPIAGTTTMDSVTTLSGLQLVYILSTPFTDAGVTFTDTSLGCILTVPDNTQITFQLLQMTKEPQQSPGCNQEIQIWDGIGYAQTICEPSTSTMTLGGCGVGGNTFYIKYLNSDPSVKVRFFISVGVSHHADGFDMRCGLQVSALPQVVVAAEPTTTTTTQAPVPTTKGASGNGVNPDTKVATAPPRDEKSLKLIIILVTVAVSLVIIVIIIGVIIKRCSRKPPILEGPEPEDLTQTKPASNYVRNIYLHGKQSSKLVMDRRRSSTPSTGSMALRV